MADVANRARVVDQRLRLDPGDGREHVLHPLWLRERCPCSECRDPQTGQRLLDAWSLPTDTALHAVHADDERIEITFSDGHVTPFELAELQAALGPREDPHSDVVVWDAHLHTIPQADWPSVAEHDAALYEMLEQLRRYAFVRVSNVPTEMDSVADVVDRIGPMRRTNWGGIADVKAIAQAYDLTMTTRALEQHTDNPYRDPVPGYIFLHCLINNADGGDSTLTDGLRVAEELRRTAPEEFDALTRVRPDFRYADADTILDNSGPLIELDEAGHVRQVRLSNRTDAVAPEDPELLDRYYRARRRLTDLVNDPALQLQFKLGPGDLLIMDNYRLLHGRTGYRPGSGDRHMRQCYMDRDSVGSRRKVLAERFAAA